VGESEGKKDIFLILEILFILSKKISSEEKITRENNLKSI